MPGGVDAKKNILNQTYPQIEQKTQKKKTQHRNHQKLQIPISLHLPTTTHKRHHTPVTPQ